GPARPRGGRETAGTARRSSSSRGGGRAGGGIKTGRRLDRDGRGVGWSSTVWPERAGVSREMPGRGRVDSGRSVAPGSVEDGPARRRQGHPGLVQRAPTLDLDEAADERVLPDGESGAGTPPGLHR